MCYYYCLFRGDIHEFSTFLHALLFVLLSYWSFCVWGVFYGFLSFVTLRGSWSWGMEGLGMDGRKNQKKKNCFSFITSTMRRQVPLAPT